MDHNQSGTSQGRGRRGHFHRGRRPDRKGPPNQDVRPTPSGATPQQARGDHVDVEQIMRDIRARIAQRHGIDLSSAQIHELAARRLEAILDPRNVNPTLLEQLRKAAGSPLAATEPAGAAPGPSYSFEDSTLYDSHRGLLRAIRRLLNPVLKLFFNPNTISHALNAQAQLNAAREVRDQERDQQQAEWNALHYELLRRVVTESARLSVELESAAQRIESLTARIDFMDRRVRTLEAPQSMPRHGGRPAPDQPPAQAVVPTAGPGPDGAQAGTPELSTAGDSRRRRRRRRGRRTGGPFTDNAAPGAPGSMAPVEGGLSEADEPFEDEPGSREDSDESPRTAVPVETTLASPPVTGPEPTAIASGPEPLPPAPQPQADGTSEPPTRPEPAS